MTSSIDPSSACLFIPPGLSKFKNGLFERIGKKIGRIVRHDFNALKALPDDITPIVGCTVELGPIIAEWRRRGRSWIYWDRGYARRVFATCLPTGSDGGYYRWHVGCYQMQRMRDVPTDRWAALQTHVEPWQRGGGHIVIAAPTRTYARFHGIESWIADTLDALALVTDRQLVIREKASYIKRPIQKDLKGAHCLVAHGTIAAVEAVILGCPVFVHPDSAAALVGQTDINKVETPIYPDREPWLNSLAYCQFNEQELVNGVLWKLIRMIHPLAHVENSTIGNGTKVWQFASVIRGALIGEDCTIGSNAMMDGSVIGDRCLIGHGAFICPGVSIGDDVFVGPYAMFCNDRWPRVLKDGFDLEVLLNGNLRLIEVGDGASIGIGAIILPGVSIGARAMIAAGAVVEEDVPQDCLLKRNGWIVPIDTGRMERMRAAHRLLPVAV